MAVLQRSNRPRSRGTTLGFVSSILLGIAIACGASDAEPVDAPDEVAGAGGETAGRGGTRAGGSAGTGTSDGGDEAAGEAGQRATGGASGVSSGGAAGSSMGGVAGAAGANSPSGAGGEGGGDSGDDACESSEDELSAVLASRPSELVQRIATALEASLTADELATLAQLDWDAVPGEVMMGDPALRKSIEVASELIDACAQAGVVNLHFEAPSEEQSCLDAAAELAARGRDIARIIIRTGATQAVLGLLCGPAVALCVAGSVYNLSRGLADSIGAGRGASAAYDALLDACMCRDVECPLAAEWCSGHDLAFSWSTCTLGICSTWTSLTDCEPYANVGAGTCKDGAEGAECVDACEGVVCNNLPDAACVYGPNGDNSSIATYSEYCYDYGSCYYSAVVTDCPNVQGMGYCRATSQGPECYDSCESVVCNQPPAPYCKDGATLATPYGPGTCYFIQSCNYPERLTTCPFACTSNECISL